MGSVFGLPITTGSMMERSKIPLNKWLMAMHLMASSKKGYSAHQLHRTLGITYQSAWFLAHRIREAMANDGLVKAKTPTQKARRFLRWRKNRYY